MSKAIIMIIRTIIIIQFNYSLMVNYNVRVSINNKQNQDKL